MKGEPGEIVLGRYRLEHQIGQGGFGRIYLARQVALARPVAIKASPPQQRNDLAIRERFRREAILVASIAHPNVVTYHDFGTDDDGDMILVMEYLRGRNLYEFVQAGSAWPLPRVAEVIRQAGEGLFAAHRAGIVHRDVKPSNLFLLDSPDHRILVKVIDFGILKVDAGVRPDLPDLTAPEAIIGTPTYLAPEVVMGLRPDPRADQYALALVACELATGRRAFGGARGSEALLQRMSRLPPELRELPAGPREVLSRALSVSIEDRYPTIVDFAQAFCEQAASEPRRRDWLSGPSIPDRTNDRSPQTEVVASAPDRTTAVSETTVEPRADPTRSIPVAKTRSRLRERLARRVGIGLGLVGLIAVGAAGFWAFHGPSTFRSVPEPRAPAPVVVLDRNPAAAPPEVAPENRPAQDLSRESGTAANGARKGRPRKETSRDSPPREPAPRPSPGRLTVNARPWADVWIDGTRVGRTPVLAHPVAPGSHSIRLVHPDFGVKTLTRVVESGESATVSVEFRSDAPRDSRPDPNTP